MKRREFVKLSAGTTLAWFLPGLGTVGCTKNSVAPLFDATDPNFCSPVDLAEEKGGFYVEYIQGKSYRPTGLDLDTWRLNIATEVSGQTIQETAISYTEMQQAIDAMKAENSDIEKTFFNTFQCVGNKPGGFLISNGYFTGVPLRDFLQKIGADPTNADLNRIFFQCFDGYHTNHKIERVLNDDPAPVWFVHKFNGISLAERLDGTLKHGYPVRLVVPDMMGMKSPKGIVNIILSDSDKVNGWWETRTVDRTVPDVTWADIPKLKVNSKFFDPVTFDEIKAGSVYTLQGIALSGANPVARVEIGWIKEGDSGENVDWQQAHILPRPDASVMPEFDSSDGLDFQKALSNLNQQTWPAPFVWCPWQFDWQVPGTPGRYRIAVRAIDTAGNTQPEDENVQERADGNNAIHSQIVQVV